MACARRASRALIAARAPQILDWRIEWTPDSRAMLVQMGPTPNVVEELWLVPVEGPGRKLNIDTSRWSGDGHVQLHPDGRHLSYVADAGEPGAEIWALENFLPATVRTRVK